MTAHRFKSIWEAKQHRYAMEVYADGLADEEWQEIIANLPKPSVVYAIGSESFIKIGVSSDAQSRLKALQTGNPTPLELLATAEGSIKHERELHRLMDVDRAEGEWFRRTLRADGLVNLLLGRKRLPDPSRLSDLLERELL